WVLVPLCVYLVLLAALRDPWSCLNLIATMLLTYAFALGATALVFVHLLGAGGLDWKVPYFLFILLVAVGVDYNVFLMTRLREESAALGLRAGITRPIGQPGGLISSAAAITACSFAAFLTSPLGSLRQLGFALVVGIAVDALIVRPVLVPCGHWLLHRRPRRALRPAIAGGMHPVEHPAARAGRPRGLHTVATRPARPGAWRVPLPPPESWPAGSSCKSLARISRVFRRPAGGILPGKCDWLSRQRPPPGKTFAAARLIRR